MSEDLPRALSQSEMEMIEARMAQRNERLAEKCSEFGLDVHGKKNKYFHQLFSGIVSVKRLNIYRK